jgi:UDP-2,3-diacylglucosamine pyrophosphatase LpxH
LRSSPTTETLIVSDLHLGIPASRPAALLEVLERWRYGRLILLGDVFHDLALRSFSLDAWRLLLHLRRLAAAGGVEVVWLKGNHDRHMAELAAMFTGIRMRESYRWTCGSRRYLAIHGDRFDAFITRNRRLSHSLSRAYGFCQRRLSRNGDWPRALDRMHSRFSGIGQEVATRAARFARRRAADAIVCGHTHEPLHLRFPCPADGPTIDYYNAGAWASRPSTFLAVDPAGVRLQHQP